MISAYAVSECDTSGCGSSRMRSTSSSDVCAWYVSISSATLHFCSDRRIFSYNCNQPNSSCVWKWVGMGRK